MASGGSFGKSYSYWQSWQSYFFLGLLPLATICGVASTKDIILVFAITLFRNREAAYRILQLHDLPLDSRILVRVFTVFATAQITRWSMNWSKPQIKPTREGPRPLLFPSRTTHTRLFPKIHSFSYSYLLVGIPVGWQGTVGGMLSADQGSGCTKAGFESNSSSSSWYSVDAGDYLDRGHRELGLDGKLRKFIQSQGFSPEDYPYAYLITAPKSLGYSFNPVSFWYLYSTNKELSAMILEVNNTFDERHMYFLKPSEDSLKELDSIETESNTVESLHIPTNGFIAQAVTDLPKKPTRFTNLWNKEFHVSPFNSRKGTYSLVAYDPLYPSMSGRGSVNNTITLKSSKSRPKLVARIFSEGDPVDPETMTTWRKSQFLVSWWWVGLVTFPRIVLEAGKLFFQRKLHVWYRPEPLKTSLGRHADAAERMLENSFRNYLRHVVKTAVHPINVTYTASGILDAAEEKMVSGVGDDDGIYSKTLELRILTPVFYSRFVRYADDLEAFFSEYRESGTIWLSEPSLLPELFSKKPRPAHSIPDPMNYLYFMAIKSLRRQSLAVEGSKNAGGVDKQSAEEEKKSNIRAFRHSNMDEYILSQSTPAEQRTYRTEVLKLFISDCIALGNIDLLEAEVFILKCLIAWALAGSVPILVRSVEQLGKVLVSRFKLPGGEKVDG